VNRAWSPSGLSYRLIGVGSLVFLLFPIVMVVWLSFTPNEFLAKPSFEFSSRWYEVIFTESRWTDPFMHSVVIAVLSAALSLLVATPAAIALARAEGRRAGALTFGVLVPFFMPGLILAVGLLMFETQIHIAGSYFGIALAHTLWGAPIAFLAIRAVYQGADYSAEEAARVLGAGPVRAFFLITVPAILPGMAVGALFAFVISFNEFLMALFLTKPSTVTLPVVIWTSLRYEVSPAVAAISAVFIGLSVIAAIIALFTVGTRGVVEIGGGKAEGETGA
jgi:putative spermidine/putrescine transport system permease protein